MVSMIRHENLSPERPLGANMADSWYKTMIAEARQLMKEPGQVHYLCRDLDDVDLSVNELKAAILCAPAFMFYAGENHLDIEDIAIYFARVLIAGKSGVHGLPQEREAPAPVATE